MDIRLFYKSNFDFSNKSARDKGPAWDFGVHENPTYGISDTRKKTLSGSLTCGHPGLTGVNTLMFEIRFEQR